MQGHQHLFWPFPGPMGLPVSQVVPPSYPYPIYHHHPPSFQDPMNTISSGRIESFKVQTRSPQYNIKPTSQTSPPALSGGRSKERAPTHIQRNNSASHLVCEKGNSDSTGEPKEKVTAPCTPSNLSARSTPNASLRGLSPTSKSSSKQPTLSQASVVAGDHLKEKENYFSEFSCEKNNGDNACVDESVQEPPFATPKSAEPNPDEVRTEAPADFKSNQNPKEATLATHSTPPSTTKASPAAADSPSSTSPDKQSPTGTTAAPEPQCAAAEPQALPSPPPSPRSWEEASLPASSAEHDMDTDSDGHFRVEPGKTMGYGPDYPHGRYTILKLLGSGTYGKVALCGDGKHGAGRVAVKAIRLHDRTTGEALYRAAALNEVRILRDLGGRHGTVRLLREFTHGRHICMAFDPLGESLHDALRRRGGRGFETGEVRDVSHQVLNAVAYVHAKGILHTDLKPENILLLPPRPGAAQAAGGAGRAEAQLVRLIDFGTAIYSDAWHPPIVGTMHYRSPEAVLQAGYGCGLDVWAMGCIAAELATGAKLFPLAHPDVHLALMEACLGPIPPALIARAWVNPAQQNPHLFYPPRGGAPPRIAPPRRDRSALAALAAARPLGEVVGDGALGCLLAGMLEHDPARRLTAAECLRHVFYEVGDPDWDDPDLDDEHLLRGLPEHAHPAAPAAAPSAAEAPAEAASAAAAEVVAAEAANPNAAAAATTSSEASGEGGGGSCVAVGFSM